jgi:hypothetical protein
VPAGAPARKRAGVQARAQARRHALTQAGSPAHTHAPMTYVRMFGTALVWLFFWAWSLYVFGHDPCMELLFGMRHLLFVWHNFGTLFGITLERICGMSLALFVLA